MATNRPDVLDPALLRPGRLDRKIGNFNLFMIMKVINPIELPLPNEQARLDILKIHALPITKMGEIGKFTVVVWLKQNLAIIYVDYEGVTKLSEDFNGADLRNVCTEAGNFVGITVFQFGLVGMFAIRADRDYVVNEDFMKAVRKVGDNKKLETKMDYKQV